MKSHDRIRHSQNKFNAEMRIAHDVITPHLHIEGVNHQNYIHRISDNIVWQNKQLGFLDRYIYKEKKAK